MISLRTETFEHLKYFNVCKWSFFLLNNNKNKTFSWYSNFFRSTHWLFLINLLCSQIYNEMIRDLLNPSSGFLDLREDSKGVIQVAGITEVSTINAQEVRGNLLRFHHAIIKPFNTPETVSYARSQIMELLMKGNKQRTQEPTAANRTSSRSHAVLQVAVKQQSRCRDVLQEVRFARLFMIDLAGSERAAQVDFCFNIVLQPALLLKSSTIWNKTEMEKKSWWLVEEIWNLTLV